MLFFLIPQNLSLTFKPVCKISIPLWEFLAGGLRFNERVVYLDFSGFEKPAGLQFAFINTLAIVPRKFDRYFERR